MSKRIDATRSLTRALAALTGAILFAMPAFAVEIVDSVEGSAQGVFVNVDVLGLGVSAGPTPSVSIPSSGGSDDDGIASVDVNAGAVGVVDTGVMDVESSASGVGTSAGEVSSSAEVVDLELIDPVIGPPAITADLVRAECTADVDGPSGSTTLLNAKAAGVSLNASPAPNTSINVAGVGTLTLNRQTTAADGTLTVTAIHLSLSAVLGSGTVYVSRAVCGVDTEDVPAPTSSTSTSSTTSTSTSTSTTTSTLPPSTSTSAPSTTTTDGMTTTTQSDLTTTTSDEAELLVCLDEHGDEIEVAVAPGGDNGPRDGVEVAGASATASSTPVALFALLLVLAAAIGAAGGFAASKFGLFAGGDGDGEEQSA